MNTLKEKSMTKEEILEYVYEKEKKEFPYVIHFDGRPYRTNRKPLTKPLWPNPHYEQRTSMP